MKILGISGKIGAGKDTLAGELAKLAPPGWAVRRFGFADEMKRVACDLWGIDIAHAIGTQEDKLRPCGVKTVREALIAMGECGRAIEPGVWIRTCMETIDAQESLGLHILAVITDVRFPNEADAIHSRGGRLIRLMRATEIRDTESETALDDYPYFDGRIDNRFHTIEQTARQAYSLLQFWGWWEYDR